MAFLTGKKKSTGTYRGVKVPITLQALLMLEDRLSKCDMSKRMDFTCNLVCRVYETMLGDTSSVPSIRRTQWGKFLYTLRIIPGPHEAMLESTVPAWVSDLAPVGATLNQIRLALVRDILKEAHNHA